MSVDISVQFDYQNQKVNFLAATDQNLSGQYVSLQGPSGPMTNRALLTSEAGLPGLLTAQAVMGLSGYAHNEGSVTGGGFVHDPYIASSANVNVWDSALYPLGAVRRAVDTTRYIGKRVVITRGNAVLNTIVTGVTSGNQAGLLQSLTNISPSYSSFLGGYMEPISGALSGHRYVVTAIGTNTATVDGDLTSIGTNTRVRFLPAATCTGVTSNADYLMLSLDKVLPASGAGHYPANPTAPYEVYWPSAVVAYAGTGVGSSYSMTLTEAEFDVNPPAYGDTILFCTGLIGGIPVPPGLCTNNDAMVTGVIANGGSSYTIQTALRNPSAPIFAWSFTLARGNHFEVEMFPQFGQDYLAVAHSGSTGVYGASLASAPEADLEVNYNEYDVTSLGARSVFQVGPLMVDGKPLTGAKLLRHQFTLYDGAYTTQSSSTDFTSNRTYGLRSNYSYNYCRDGLFVTTLNQEFNAADMLELRASISAGDATVSKILPIAVQPPL